MALKRLYLSLRRILLLTMCLVGPVSCGSAESRANLLSGAERRSPARHVQPPSTLSCFAGEEWRADQDRPWVAAMLSPRMVYSLQEWPRMQQVAEAMGFRVVAWRDPRVPDEEWRSAMLSALAAGWRMPWPRPLPKGCWSAWEPVNHVPLTRVLWQGHMHDWPIWGVMPDSAWREALGNRLNALLEAHQGQGSSN